MVYNSWTPAGDSIPPFHFVDSLPLATIFMVMGAFESGFYILRLRGAGLRKMEGGRNRNVHPSFILTTWLNNYICQFCSFADLLFCGFAGVQFYCPTFPAYRWQCQHFFFAFGWVYGLGNYARKSMSFGWEYNWKPLKPFNMKILFYFMVVCCIREVDWKMRVPALKKSAFFSHAGWLGGVIVAGTAENLERPIFLRFCHFHVFTISRFHIFDF